MSSRKAAQKKTESGKRSGNHVNPQMGYVLFILFAAMALLILIGPFFRGLFFPGEMLVVHLVSFALFALWSLAKLRQQGGGYINSPLEICFFALVLFYFLSIFFAVNVREALGEFLKIANYFVVYLLAFDLCRNLNAFQTLPPRPKKTVQSGSWALFPFRLTVPIFLHVFLISGVAMALVGLAAVSGFDFLGGGYVWGRLYSPLQYANAAAVYFLASLFLSFGLILAGKKLYQTLLYMIPAFILFISTILTFSRAVWLLMPLLLLLFIVLIGRGERLRLFLNCTVLISVGLPSALLAYDAFLKGSLWSAWGYITLALTFCLVLTILVNLFLTRLTRKQKIALAGLAVLIPVLVGFFWLQGELRQPLHLQRKADEKPGEQYFEHTLAGVKSGEHYRLSLEIKASGPDGGESDKEYYAWKLAVLYEFPDPFSNEYLTAEVLEHREGSTGGWQKREFEFQTPVDIRRLTVRLYNRFPGTEVTYRNITLQGPEGDKKLSFNLHRILPSELYSRILLFRTEITEEPRIAHYRDALKIIRDYPFLGAGGGAWNSLYAGYMIREYITTEPHSHLLKVWIEAGPLAFLAFLGIWFFYTVSFLRFLRRPPASPEVKATGSAIFMAIAALVLHAAVDFTLSLGAVSFYLFALLGAGRSLIWDDAEPWPFIKKTPKSWPNKKPVSVIFGLVVSLILLVYSISLWQGYRAAAAGKQFLEQGYEVQAEYHLRQAARWDSRQAENYAILSGIYKYRAETAGDQDESFRLMNESLSFARQAWELNQLSTVNNRQYGLLLLNFGEIEQGLLLLEKNPKLNPFNPDHYAQLAAAYLAAVEYYLHSGENEKAAAILTKMVELEAQIKLYHDSSAGLFFYLGKAYYLMGDNENALLYLSEVGKNDMHYLSAINLLRQLPDNPTP